MTLLLYHTGVRGHSLSHSPVTTYLTYVPSDTNRELGICSDLISEELTYHMPMLDLSIPLTEDPEAALQELDGALGVESMIYTTGASYHAYWPCLVTPVGFSIFMQMALRTFCADVAWVNASSVRGYGVLRWTHNTKTKQRIRRYQRTKTKLHNPHPLDPKMAPRWTSPTF